MKDPIASSTAGFSKYHDWKAKGRPFLFELGLTLWFPPMICDIFNCYCTLIGLLFGCYGKPQFLFLLTGFASFFPLCEEATTARYWITFLVFSVFPAPDSPLGDRVEVRMMKGGRHYNRGQMGEMSKLKMEGGWRTTFEFCFFFVCFY